MAEVKPCRVAARGLPWKAAAALAATVLNTADPMEPPICCAELTVADAMPESCAGTSEVAPVMMARKLPPIPTLKVISAGRTFAA